MRRAAGPWLSGPAFDLPLVILPGLLCALVAPLLPPGLGLSPLAFFFIVVLFDVGHVWATLARLCTDRSPGALARALGLPLAVVAVLVPLALGCVALGAPALYWRVLSYVAVFHFIRQQVGVAMLYRAAAGLSAGPAAAAEGRAHWALAGFPVLWWHVHLPRPFSWFHPDDFVPGLPALVLVPAGVVAAGLVADHLRHRIREGGRSLGRDLWLLNTAAVWGLGIIGAGGDLAFTLPNVMHHAVPYLALVALIEHRRAASGLPGAFPIRLVSGVGLVVLLGAAILFGVVEEALWEVFVWGDHPTISGRVDPWAWLGGWLGADGWLLVAEEGEPVPTASALALATALLSVPQVSHYLLDGLIWSGRRDPSVRRLLGADPPQANGPGL